MNCSRSENLRFYEKLDETDRLAAFPSSADEHEEENCGFSVMKDLQKESASEVTLDEPAQVEVPEDSTRDQVRGKFTIQLGSYQSIADAQSFADGFRVRGYKVIVNEVELNGRGIWFRVSLGIFDSVSEAKSYVLREKVLFKGQDYVIGRFN